MANKTRLEIKNQIYEYLPQINQSSKDTLINNCIDLAVEEISAGHDFRSLRGIAPDEAYLATGSWYIDMSSISFSAMMASGVKFKHILAMYWRKYSGGDDYSEVKFLDDAEFRRRYGYYDYTGRQTGYPTHYTKVGNRLIFNCPAYEALYIRCFYQTIHPDFVSDSTSHNFDSRMNMKAFFAILYRALMELKSSLNNLEFPQDLTIAMSNYPQLVQSMVDLDKTIPDEDFEVGWNEKNGDDEVVENLYGWVS